MVQGKKILHSDCRGVDPNSGYPDDVVDIDNENECLRSAREEYDAIPAVRKVRGKEDTELKRIKEKLYLQRFDYIKEHCNNTGECRKGVVYFLNNNIYGINLNEILDGLENNNMAVIISDFNAINEIRQNKKFVGRVKVVYIASSMDERELLKRYKGRVNDASSLYDITDEGLNDINYLNNVILSSCRLGCYTKIENTMLSLNDKWNSMLKYYYEIKSRAAKIRMLYNKYIDKIDIIDHVILNFQDIDYMFSQMRNIIIHNNNNLCETKMLPPIFMVCAATSSGKGMLMEIIGDIGKINGSIVQVKKYAKRNAQEADRRDNMVPIGENGDFYNCGIKKVFSWRGHKEVGNKKLDVRKEREYALDIQEIEDNLRNGIPQIFVANFDVINDFPANLKQNLVVLYLHATHPTETKKHIIEKRTKAEITKLKDNDKNISEKELEEKLHTEEIQMSIQEKVEADLDEIQAIHNKYVKFNMKVDHVLLNTGTQVDLVEQMLNLIKKYSDKSN